jgi:hypothetical protein
VADYEYAEGVITSYRITGQNTVVLDLVIPDDNNLKQKFEIDYANWPSNAGNGTRVKLRIQTPVWRHTWHIVGFL